MTEILNLVHEDDWYPQLILPGDPEFEETLAWSFPPDWRQVAYKDPNFGFICRPGSFLAEAVPRSEFEEYAYGGEWDERQAELDALEEAENGWPSNLGIGESE